MFPQWTLRTCRGHLTSARAEGGEKGSVLYSPSPLRSILHTRDRFFFPALPDECVTLSVNSGMRMKMRSKFPRQRTRNTTKDKPTPQTKPQKQTQARSLSCLGKCKLGETSETCAPLSAPQKFSSTSMYFSMCPVLNVSHVNICHHALRRIPDIRLQALSLDLIRAFTCLPLFRTILQKEIDFRLCSTFFVVKCLQ